jgi:hypothetical protein
MTEDEMLLLIALVGALLDSVDGWYDDDWDEIEYLVLHALIIPALAEAMYG